MSKQQPKKKPSIIFDLGDEPVSIELDIPEQLITLFAAKQKQEVKELSISEIKDLLGLPKFLTPYEYKQVINGIKEETDYKTKLELTILLASRSDIPELAAPVFREVLQKYYGMDGKERTHYAGVLYLEDVLERNEKIPSELLEDLATPPEDLKWGEVTRYYRALGFLPKIKYRMHSRIGQILARSPVQEMKIDLLKRDDLDHHTLVRLAESANPKIMQAWIANPTVRSDKIEILSAIDRWAMYRMRAAALVPKNIDLVIENLDKLVVNNAREIAKHIVDKKMPYSFVHREKLLSYVG